MAAGRGIVAQVSGKTQAPVGLHRVHAMVLQLIGLQLVHQSDSAPFLVLVNEQAATLGCDVLEGQFELVPAVATQ